ncbi:hypothetical protein [Curtobacterium sp. MCSS17_016]|uniref:hypothetical protein n=1 Tax=Curtobacterium sp. MCSS17_016 TaxID=2175644 RepID=UPI000DA9D25B|nr:hypothetical protein [Curtobacterium sp. MCSS17_016]WIE81420.1 hypothetical protein DEJ19_019485 [Curtobacterium sp. MCSS17_016]
MNTSQHSEALIDEHILEAPDGRRVRFISAPAFASERTWTAVQSRLPERGSVLVTADAYKGDDERGGAAHFAHWRTVAEGRGLVRRSEAARLMGAVQLEVDEESFRRAWRSPMGLLIRAIGEVAYRFKGVSVGTPFDNVEVARIAVDALADELADLAASADDDTTFITDPYASGWAQQRLEERGFTDVTPAVVQAPRKRAVAQELDELARTGRTRMMTEATVLFGGVLLVLALLAGANVRVSIAVFASAVCAAGVLDRIFTRSARRQWRLAEVAIRDELATAGV